MTHDEFMQRYRFEASRDKLGEGGFGSVFKAYDTVRDRFVAVKIAKVNAEYENLRLKKEVEMVATLPPHPNIAFYEECYTFASFDGEYDFGVLQYYEEGNLLQLMKKETLNEAQRRALLTQLLEGVGFLHANGILHRDLKPQNVLIVRRGNDFIPKITDFGISKKLNAGSGSILSNSLMGAGTLLYASPEQLNESKIRHNTDLWSFGVIAYQVFTGQLPFNTGAHSASSESGRMELYRQIETGTLPEALKDIPEPWQLLVRRCLLPNPAERVQTVEECKNMLFPDTAFEEIETRMEATGKAADSSDRAGACSANDVSSAASTSNHAFLKRAAVGLAAIAAVGAIAFAIRWGISRDSLSPREAISTVTQRDSLSPREAISTITQRDSLPPREAISTGNEKKTDAMYAVAMVYVQGGKFTMGCTAEQGSDCGMSEKPEHQVTLSSFHISKTEVTQMLWQVVTGSNPSRFKGDNLPVENVSWNDVQMFISRLNALTGKHYRLPTEAEWEYAARGGSRSLSNKYSGSASTAAVAWYDRNSGNATHIVGCAAPNELGVYDMSGNVSEWCADLYGSYAASPQTNPAGASSGNRRVVRGGDWLHNARLARNTARNSQPPTFRSPQLGFRLAQ